MYFVNNLIIHQNMIINDSKIPLSLKTERESFKNMTIYRKPKNIFRQISTFASIVDKVINIIPIEPNTFHPFINKVITSYPPEPVDS